MTFAFGHLVGAWLAGKAREWNSPGCWTRIAWALLLGGAILPDVDYLVEWTMGIRVHRTLTHSLVFLVAVPLITYGFAGVLKKKYSFFRPKLYATAIGLGIFTHLLIDMAEGFPGIALFWPADRWYYVWGTAMPDATGIFEFDVVTNLKRAIVDMAIGTAWVGYLVVRDRIQL